MDDQKQITLAKIIDIKPGDAHYRLSEKKNTAIVRFINTAGETDSFHYIEGIYEKLLDEKEITKTNFKRFALDRSYIFIETEHFQDWYKFTSGGLVYTHTTYQGLTREVIFSNTPGYDSYQNFSTFQAGGGAYDSNIGANYDGKVSLEERTIEKINDDNIITDPNFINYPCAKIIVEQAYGVCSPLNQLLLDIFEANDKVNLVYAVSSTIPGNGRTSQTYTFNPATKTMDINIWLNESYLSTATDLSIARTTIHESVHAILVYMLEEGKFTSVTGNPDPEFKDLVEAFINFNANKPSNYGKAHHEIMSELVAEMASSLSVYGQHRGYNLPFSYYEKLSYAGAISLTPTFKGMFPEYLNANDAFNNPNNRNPEFVEIKEAIDAELTNSIRNYTYPNGTKTTTSPKGKPATNNVSGNCN